MFFDAGCKTWDRFLVLKKNSCLEVSYLVSLFRGAKIRIFGRCMVNNDYLNIKAKIVTFESLCSRTNVPLCFTMICFDKLKPIPVPFGLVV